MGTSKGRVLIVDDTEENVWALATALKSTYTIMIAKDGKTALELARGEPAPDIILLDVIMPDMDGYSVCRCLKDDPGTRNIPIIFITAQSGSGHEALGLSLGAVDYVHKPFEPSLVLARVESQLTIKRHSDMLDELVRERTRELILTREATIKTLATVAEWRDPETGSHIKRTRAYVQILSEQLRKLPEFAPKLSTADVELLTLSAPLHDVGKVSIPDYILFKPSKLTPEEYDIMKRHTIFGAKALAIAENDLGGSSFLRTAQEIALSHHEHWDGGGYPNGLAGEAIPLSARIMSVADVYDALISRRVYKNPMPHAGAVATIMKKRGSQFDPVVIDVFASVSNVFQCIAEEYDDDSVQ